MLPQDQLQLDQGGFVITDQEMCTNIPGVTAAGDIRSKKFRQIVNAAGEGAVALLSIEEYLGSRGDFSMPSGDRMTFPPRVLFNLLLALLLLCTLGAVPRRGSAGYGAVMSLTQSPEALAMEAMDDYRVGKYVSALEKFSEILDRYPFSPQAMLAELKSADCHYFRGELEEAKQFYQQFIDMHPT